MSKIPEGFTTVTPYVVVDDPAAAIEFYGKALGAEERMRFAMPDGTIMYAELQIGSARMMLGAPCPEYGAKSVKEFGGSPVSFYIYVEDIEAAFNKAKDAGMTEKKPIEEMFWGDKMGTLADCSGLEWTIAEHVRDVSPEEMQEAMKNMAA